MAQRYRMEDDEIIELAHAIKAGDAAPWYYSVGRTRLYQGPMWGIISRIKDKTGLAITLSIGQRPYEDYKAFREAGADRYLLRHETANPNLYADLCPGRTLDERMQCLKGLKELDYEVGMGCMVGLPGQTVQDLADDVLLSGNLRRT